MIKKLIPLLVVALTASCAQQECEQDAAQVLQDETVETVYHPATNTVLAKVSEDSRLISTKAEDATHYAVKFLPKSTNELFTLIRTENVMTSYYPFGYMPTNLSRSESTSDSEVFDENPYTETYTNPDDPEDVFVTTLPVIYAYWPIAQALPEDIDYEMCFPVRMPGDDNGREEMTRDPSFLHQYPMYIRTYDSKLASYVPMRNLKVRLSYGTVWADLYTGSNGYVLIDPMTLYNVSTFLESRDVTVTLIYETGKWIISSDNATNPIHVQLGAIKDIWTTIDLEDTQADPYYLNLASSTKECEIHRAVDYYHNSTHQLTSFIDSDEEGVVIHAMSTSNGSRAGTDFSTNTPTILVYNNSGQNQTQERYIGSIIHELGHVHQYYVKNVNSSTFLAYDRSFLESYASYVGWLVGEYYYTSKGYVKSGPGEDLCQQSRQTWYYGSTGEFSYYTPFYVDLIDQYNQYTTGTSLPDDPISGVPVSLIEYMGATYTSLPG